MHYKLKNSYHLCLYSNSKSGYLKIINKHFYFFCLFLFLPGYFIAYGQINADFSASSTVGCTPFNVQFKDLSAGTPTQWIWDFGNGTSSNLQNPVASFTNPGTYTIRLIVKNAVDQNFVIKKDYITVSATPDVSFSIINNSGCLPLSVTFTNNTNLFGASIKSWLWNFGDGNSSNQQSPSNTYNTRGVNNVTLTAQTLQGCTDSLTINGAVKAGNKPTNISFTANPLDGCASALRKFTSSSAGNTTTQNWYFGDGGTDNSKTPSYHYTDTGWFSVKLVVSDYGCADSVQYNSYVHVNGPIATIFNNVNCTDPYNVRVYARSNGAQSWDWDYGDGATSTLRDAFHRYAATGIYYVKLTVTGGGCIDSARNTIYVADQNPSYNIIPSKTSYCKNDSIEFTVSNYDSALTGGFSWSFDGGITKTSYRLINDSIKNVYSQAGIYPSPILYVQNKEHCFDTIKTTPLIITGPTAAFNSSSPLCIGNTIDFLNESIPFKNSPINQSKWNFGDGDSILVSDSAIKHAYPFSILYKVLLKITDTDGCTDTISHEININDTPVINAGRDTLICAGKPVTLQPSGGATYTWSNSPYLSCTNCANPIAIPLDTATFYVTGKNAAGCASRDSIKINAQQEQKVTVQPATDTICTGDSIQLVASGADFYKWQPANELNNPNIPNPLATPLVNTIYTVTGTDKLGCSSNTSSINIVANPKPTVNITDSVITLQPGAVYNIKSINSSDVIKWQWQPSQWLSDPTAANPVIQPQQSITYTVTGETAGGCISKDQIIVNVICNSSILFVPNTFSPNNDGMNDYFYPRSSTSINIKALKIFNRWGQEIFKADNFSTNDQSSGWNGKYNGVPQQADVYVYLMQITCSNGSTFSKQGSITLVR